MIELTACLTANATTIQRRISINPLHIAVVREDQDRALTIVVLADSNSHRYTVAEPYDVVMMRLFEALHPGELPAIMSTEEAEAGLAPLPEAVSLSPAPAVEPPATFTQPLFTQPEPEEERRWPGLAPWQQAEPPLVRYEVEQEKPAWEGVSAEATRSAQTRALLGECVAQIDKYLASELSVGDFKAWFRPRWAALRQSGDPVAQELDYTVGTLLALFSSNTYGEDAFKYLLRKVHVHMLETLTRAGAEAHGRAA